MNEDRNLNYDLIRLLGLIVIMIAHSSPPDWLFQLRNFGAPLLVFGSGLTYALIYASREIQTWTFYKKRLSKIILPAWIFLAFFFVSFYCASVIAEKSFPFHAVQILKSFVFMQGIDFVWIFKIYVILALATPICIYLNTHVANDKIYFLSLIAFYVLYEFLNQSLSPYLAGTIETIFDSIIFIVTPYFLIYLYAFRINRLRGSLVLILATVSFVIFLGMATVKYQEAGVFIQTQAFKYPPTLYYLSYAFFAINIIYLLVKNIDLTGARVKRTLIWLSSNALWIYLWHIFAFYIWKFALKIQVGDLYLFVAKTLFLFGVGIALTIFQNKLVSILSRQSDLFARRLAPLLTNDKR